MKRYSLIVVLHIAAILLCAGGICLLLFFHLWFSALMALVLLSLISFHLYRMQMIQMRMMRHLAESLRNDDMMTSFRAPYRNRSLEGLVEELSEAMNMCRNRIFERYEMEAWQKLIRVLTHEIMNSITPIISLSETLSEGELTPQEYPMMKQAMQAIYRRSSGLLEFVQNYRKLTRLPMPNCSMVSVFELFQDLHEFFPEPYIHINMPEKDKLLQIDRAQIEQVLINLIKNAKEACKHQEEPCIKIGVQPALSWQYFITVQDNGEGILPEVLDKIFVPFFTTKSTGSGIGLSLCKLIMNRHGGNILVDSIIGQGTCFTLQFS